MTYVLNKALDIGGDLYSPGQHVVINVRMIV